MNFSVLLFRHAIRTINAAEVVTVLGAGVIFS
jgi:hypothetical protein